MKIEEENVVKRKINKNQVEIDGILYIKDKTAIKFKGEYVPKKLLELDTFTSEYNLKSKLKPYRAINGSTLYSSNLIVIFVRSNTYNYCASILDQYPDLMLHPGTDKGYYCSMKDEYIYGDFKYSPKEKIYNFRDINYKMDKLSKEDNRLNFLKDLTYGFELETANGIVHQTNSSKYGFANLYDGSITGAEYTSCIMTYDNFHHLRDFLDLAKLVTAIDNQCSLHIHIGGIKYSDENLLATYVLFQRLQDELNGLIAPYKKDYKFLAKKDKDHCRNLPKLIDKTPEEVFNLFHIGDYYNNREELPRYLINRNKWTVEGRYYTVNFLNYICNKTTIELRSLQATYNFDYIMTWLLINTSIIKFAETNYDKIINSKEKIELQDCLSFFIRDEKLLEVLLYNIKQLNSYYYKSQHFNKNMLSNTQSLDKDITKIIEPLNIFNDKKVVINTNFYRDFIEALPQASGNANRKRSFINLANESIDTLTRWGIDYTLFSQHPKIPINYIGTKYVGIDDVIYELPRNIIGHNDRFIRISSGEWGIIKPKKIFHSDEVQAIKERTSPDASTDVPEVESINNKVNNPTKSMTDYFIITDNNSGYAKFSSGGKIDDKNDLSNAKRPVQEPVRVKGSGLYEYLEAPWDYEHVLKPSDRQPNEDLREYLQRLSNENRERKKVEEIERMFAAPLNNKTQGNIRQPDENTKEYIDRVLQESINNGLLQQDQVTPQSTIVAEEVQKRVVEDDEDEYWDDGDDVYHEDDDVTDGVEKVNTPIKDMEW